MGNQATKELSSTPQQECRSYSNGSEIHDRLTVLSTRPYIVQIEDLIGPQECRGLVDLAEPLMQRSTVSDGQLTGSRTSWNMFILDDLKYHPLAEELEQAFRDALDTACKVTGRPPLIMGEATQIVRYSPGQFYALHYDNDHDNSPNNDARFQRAATIILYLNDVGVGGETHFPRCVSPGGVKVRPRLGRAIVFWSILPDGSPDTAALHAALKPIYETKWIATRWCYQTDDNSPLQAEQ